MAIKLKDLENLDLITDLHEPDKIWLCKIKSKEFLTMPDGPKADVTEKCMAAVACLMNLMSGDKPGAAWECEAGTLIWERKQK